MAAYRGTAGFMTHVTCRLATKNRTWSAPEPYTLSNRVWATFLGRMTTTTMALYGYGYGFAACRWVLDQLDKTVLSRVNCVSVGGWRQWSVRELDAAGRPSIGQTQTRAWHSGVRTWRTSRRWPSANPRRPMWKLSSPRNAPSFCRFANCSTLTRTLQREANNMCKIWQKSDLPETKVTVITIINIFSIAS